MISRLYKKFVLVLVTAWSQAGYGQWVGENGFEGFEATYIGTNGSGSVANFDGSNGSLLLEASDGAVLNAEDEFLFVHKPAVGDLDFVARVDLNGNGVAGLMLRTDLESDSQHVSLIVDYNSGTVAINRMAKGGPRNFQSQFVQTGLPVYLALVREKHLFYALIAMDAPDLEWRLLGDPFAVDMPLLVHAGVMATSNSSNPAIARFSEIYLAELGQRDALFVSQNVPTLLTPGESRRAKLVFENSGTLPWIASSGIQLAWVGSNPNPWGVDSIPLPPGVEVLSGESFEFSFDLVASAEPGVHEFQWRMAQIGVGSFGDPSVSTLVEVAETPFEGGTSAGVPGETYPEFYEESFLEEGGEVVFEAESYQAATVGSHGEAWQNHGYIGDSGYSLMASPNASVNSRLETTGARVDYYFNIQSPDDYFIYIRGADPEGNGRNDSVHVAVDGQVLTNDAGLGLNEFVREMSWRQRAGDPLFKVRVSIPTPGVHKLTIWSREDGVVIDRIALSTNGNLAASYLDGLLNSRRVSDSIVGGSTGGTASAPVAMFTRATSPGEGSLTVTVDASDSSGNGASIVDYDWNWGDGTAHGKGASGSHTYETAGIYKISLKITDSLGATSSKVHSVQVTGGGLPSLGMSVRELGYSHIELAWNDGASWEHPWMIQRSTIASFINPTDLTDNQAADNTGEGTFRWLGVNADNFVDIDGIAEGTTYFWRAAPVTNLSAHYRHGANPTYGEWIYGSATTKTLASSKKRTYNVKDYGAVPNDGHNDYPAALAALAAAEAAEGGIVYFPAGTYDIWPTDGDVTMDGGIPTLRSGGNAVSTLFGIRANNITFLGDAQGAPTTFWNLYLWGKKPATSWLRIQDGSGNVSDVRRYFVFKPFDVAQTTIKNIDVDMGAPAVNTGKEWYTLDHKRYEWDISHKFWSAHDTTRGKNTIIENVRVKNCRGEIIYVGGASEKILVKDCILERSNSSSISMSADAEIVDTIIRDSSNAAVESILLATRTGLDGQPFAQNHIARGCTFIGLDQSPSGFMKNLPGRKTFSGWHVFNGEGTYQTVTDSIFMDCVNNSFGPWYEYRNGLRFNCTFGAVPSGYEGSTIYTWTSSQPEYLIDGGMSEILWIGDTVNVAKNWSENSPFFYSQPGSAANSSESPWIWDAVHFKKTGSGTYQVGRVWLDTATQSNARKDAVFKNWTSDSGISFAPDKLLFLNSSAVRPTFVNFLE